MQAHYQLVPVDSAAHTPADHECEATEHRALGDVLTVRQQPAHASRELQVVGYGDYSRRVLGSPKAANTLVSANPASPATRSPRNVSTINP